MDTGSVRVIAIMGATATGKSDAAIDLARRFEGEIVSMDSRQVYRRMDIGTAKVTPSQRAQAVHHLVDILDPTESGSAGRHAELAHAAVRAILARGKVPFLVGGTGLYFRAFRGELVDVVIPPDVVARLRSEFEGQPTSTLYERLRATDPQRAAELSPRDRMRITRALELVAWTGEPASRLYGRQRAGESGYEMCTCVLTMPREMLRERIAERTRAMFDAGWEDEVRALVDAGVGLDSPGMQSLGYAEIAAAILSGKPPRDVLEQVITRTRQYAKRQETFFRGQRDARWLDVSTHGWREELVATVGAFLDQ